MALRCCLDHLTFPGLSGSALARVARQAGYDCISLFVECPAPGFIDAVSAAEVADVEAICADSGLAVGTLECFVLGPDEMIDSYEAALERGARLGAGHATAINAFGHDRAQAAAWLARFAQLCARFGIVAQLEPYVTGATSTLRDGAALIEAAGQANTALVVDALHWFRSGAQDADLAAAARHVSHIQLCDAPATTPRDDWEREAGQARRAPGLGDIPLARLLAGLPTDRATVGLEVPGCDNADPVASAGDLLARARQLVTAKVSS